MYANQEPGLRPMHRNTFWTSVNWMMPAGSGCKRTGRVRNVTGLDQVEWVCPGHGVDIWNPYSYLGGLAANSGLPPASMGRRPRGLPKGGRNPGAGLAGLAGWQDIELPSCPTGYAPIWLNQASIDRRDASLGWDPRCTLTEVTRDPGALQRALCCPQDHVDDLAEGRAAAARRTAAITLYSPGGVVPAGIGTIAAVLLGGAVVVTGAVLGYRYWRSRRSETHENPSACPLFWSEQGAIACSRHAPYRGSDTWVWERWTPISRAEAAEMRSAGLEPRCEVCGCEDPRL